MFQNIRFSEILLFGSNTVLIVGAGASNEFGLPLGSQLAAKIANLWKYQFSAAGMQHGDGTFLRLVKKLCGDDVALLNEHLAAGREITSGVQLAESIDSFIDIHRHNAQIEQCGKASIVYEILRAEHRSGLSKFQHSSYKKTWLENLARLATSNLRKDRLESELLGNLTIICFNYDRCIEEFFAHWLTALYSIPIMTSRALVKMRLQIIRPYGSIDELPDSRNPNGLTFGHDVEYLALKDYVPRIKTYSEQVTDEKLLLQIRTSLADAAVIVFAGFGFNKPNMKLLTLPEAMRSKPIGVYASAFGLSPSDAGFIQQQIAKVMNMSRNYPMERIAVRHELKALELFSEYRFSISR